MSLKVGLLQVGRDHVKGSKKEQKKMANHWRRQQWRRDLEAEIAKLYRYYF